GQIYAFVIAAINARGVGLPSQSTDPVTVGAPTAPGSPTAVSGNSAVKVSWTKPADNGSVLTAYTVTTYSNGRVVQTNTFDTTTTTRTISALTNGSPYTFTIAASNAWG